MTARASSSLPFCPGSCRYAGKGAAGGGRARPGAEARAPQVLAGIYPIAQIQEPYTAVGYLATRVPVQALLHLRHPEAEDPAAEHPWCAWDICEGGFRGLAPPLAFCPALSPRLSSEVLPSNFLALPGSVTGSQLADLACAGETGKMC